MNYFFSFKKTIDACKRTEAYNMHKWKREKYLARKNTWYVNMTYCYLEVNYGESKLQTKMQSNKEVNY